MQTLSPAMKSFIRSHMPEEAEKLLLAASRYPEIDVPFAVEQLLARRQVREKLPSWHANEDVVYPSRLAAEQCSSEATARYKQALARGGSCCDLTGGLGVDAFYFAQRVAEVTYVERFAAYCEAAAHNFAVLGAGNIRVVQGDARELAGKVEADTFYIDPARRGEGNRRVFALTDCEPDVLQLKAALLGKAKRVVVKISPMADISVLRESFGESLKEVHVVAVGGEVKELLCILERGSRPFGGIYAVDAVAPPEEEGVSFSFLPEEEKEAPLVLAEGLSPGQIVLEPSACMLKAGAFRLPCARFGLRKLAPSTHLYLAGPDGTPPSGLFGRFAIEELLPLNSASIRLLKSRRLRADVSARNLPLGSAELARRLGCVSDAGLHVFGCATACSGNLLILASPLRESQP